MELNFRNLKEKYSDALSIARERLPSLDVEDICRRAAAENIDAGKLRLRFLNRNYIINYPATRVGFCHSERSEESQYEILRDAQDDCDETMDPELDILLLHYLIDSKDVPLSGELVSYHQLKDGPVFYGAFRNIAEKPIIERFGNDPESFKKACLSLGGKALQYRDVSFELLPFPRISITYILGVADEELPATCSVLFDSSAIFQLHIEDLAVLGEVVSHEIIRMTEAG